MYEKSTIQALNELIAQIRDRRLRSVEWTNRIEWIKTPSVGTFQERRSGPRKEITIMLDFADVEPADFAAGEVSEGI